MRKLAVSVLQPSGSESGTRWIKVFLAQKKLLRNMIHFLWSIFSLMIENIDTSKENSLWAPRYWSTRTEPDFFSRRPEINAFGFETKFPCRVQLNKIVH